MERVKSKQEVSFARILVQVEKIYWTEKLGLMLNFGGLEQEFVFKWAPQVFSAWNMNYH